MTHRKSRRRRKPLHFRRPLMEALEDRRLLATLEAMYLHVNMASGKVAAATDEAMQPLMEIASTHTALPSPDAAGRHVGQR